MNNFNAVNENMMLSDLTEGDSFIEDIFKIKDILPVSNHPDLITLSRQLENLTIEGNTQSLQIKIERMKRRQLRSSLRSLEQAVQRPCADTVSLKQELITTQETKMQSITNSKGTWQR